VVLRPLVQFTKLAEAIYNSSIPIISAVGHQIDFTIADFVADKRAATPTAAAELAVPNIEDISLNIDNYINKLNINIQNRLDNYRTIINRIKESYIMKNPMAIYEIKINNIKNIIEKLTNNIKNNIILKKTNIFRLSNSYIMLNPNFIYEKKKDILNKYIEKVELLNPMNSLKRGYSILKKNNKSVNSIKKLSKDDNVDITLIDGIVNANIISIKEDL
jgi:exodeoxyribonuclease VII large subunit